ncbi:MAG: RNA polymerase factor sigma-70, partial [Planctomycetaceae bacterium]|nr:RNA polymerase factor sigma-70 [Planctomycetaceae bacterium]
MWPTTEKTIALLAQKQAGDDDAWNQLLDRHRKSLHRMIQLRLDRRIRQRVDVSDVLQDVLIEANRRIDRYLDNPIMDFHLWIRQIA